MAINPLDLLLNKFYLVVKCSYCQQISPIKILDSCEIEPLDTNYSIYFTILKEDFCLRYEASIEFSSIINNLTIRNSIKQFQDHTTDTIKYLDHICCYCSCFINLFN